ncbi:hypothetical protein EV657_12413 [Rhodovulum visakhapatnamense]|uniref:Uncharacterized protein n=1 Tax=Rhodovulum visakhapatnamense TaxID=364297 RepID=A0A4R8FE34_9RHOB|nr:hypothetical protein EV657_12413 [Rhodovulum visakhapatnamense]
MAGSKTVLAPPEVPGSDPAPLGAPVCEIQETALRPEASGRMADARNRAMARPGPLAAPGLDPGAAPWGSGKPPSGPRLVRQPQPSLSFARPTSALICGLHGACAPLTSGIAVSGQAGHDACGQVRAGRKAASARRRVRPPRRRTASCLRAAGGPDARLRPGSRRLPAAGRRSGAPDGVFGPNLPARPGLIAAGSAAVPSVSDAGWTAAGHGGRRPAAAACGAETRRWPPPRPR